MDAIKNLLNSGLFASLLAIVSIIVAVYFYFVPRTRNRLLYKTSGVRLIGDHGQLPPEVTVRYWKEPVQMLSNSTIIIWNGGDVTLDGSAITGDDPLRLVFGEDTTVLNAEVLKVSRNVIHFSAQNPASRNCVLLTFDFLDIRDGAVIRVLHTGKRLHAALIGTIKGMPKGIVDAGIVQSPALKRPAATGLSMTPRSVVLLGCGGGIVTSLLAAAGIGESLDAKFFASKGFYLYPLLFFVAIGALALLFPRRRYPKSLQLDE
jgi:hypothetical protein